MRGARALACIGACAALVAPPLRELLEGSMTRHMLVQLPLLAALGLVLGTMWLEAPQPGIAGRLRTRIDGFNAGGATGLIVAGFTLVLWMLPRSLDAARLDASIDVLKAATLLAAGAAVALSWPRCPPLARLVIHVEAIAMFLRFGWGYAASQERLCAAYLQGDQQRAGVLLVALGLAYAVAVAWRPMFGNVMRSGGRLQAPER